jgi:hypothetical protein
MIKGTGEWGVGEMREMREMTLDFAHQPGDEGDEGAGEKLQ